VRLQTFPWLGQEFISLSWEGDGEGTVEDEVRAVYAHFVDWLGRFELTLDHTVRTRQYCRDMETWQAASAARGRILTGAARSVSSSHVRPARLVGNARITADLLAMVPPSNGERKILKEYEPATVVLRHLTWGGIVFLSGVTDMTHATLDEQFPVIIHRLSESLADANASWDTVARASFFLHRDESLQDLRQRFAKTINAQIPALDYTFVDTRQGKRLEIELTATLA
jgi:enamine deaminase RidA (YjgF/YER057c/UK114 family)